MCVRVHIYICVRACVYLCGVCLCVYTCLYAHVYVNVYTVYVCILYSTSHMHVCVGQFSHAYTM